MSCWTTLGPFRRPTGPQNGPKQHQNGPSWPQMSIHDPKWPLNTSHGYITWYYVMLDHPGAFSEAHGGPKMAQNSTKNGPSWPKMALHDPNGPKTLLMGILHDIMSCWTTLGPFQRPTWPQTLSEIPIILTIMASNEHLPQSTQYICNYIMFQNPQLLLLDLIEIHWIVLYYWLWCICFEVCVVFWHIIVNLTKGRLSLIFTLQGWQRQGF